MPKSIIGTVSSSKADKTIVVSVQTRKTHPLYRKQFTSTRKFMAHDEKNAAETGDRVEIVETRPLSAKKRFKLARIIEKPALRQDALGVANSEDTGKKPAKEKTAEEAPEPKVKKEASK